MNETKATRYQRLRRRVQVVTVLSGAAVLALVALTPLARRATDALLQFTAGLPPPFQRAATVAIGLLGLVALLESAAVPGWWLFERRQGPRYGRARASTFDVLTAHAQGALVAAGLALSAGAVWNVAIAVGGPWWWAVAAGLVTLLLVGALRGAPAALAWLASAREISRPQLTAWTAEIATRAKVPVTGVHEWQVGDRAATTAIVTGFGRTRRVFISSAVLRDWSDDEIAVVIAHELGHHSHHDLWRTLALDAAVLAVALWAADAAVLRAAEWSMLTGPSDPAAVPLLLLVAGAVWAAATPIRNLASRRQERRADMFALTMTGRVDAFTAAVRRLAAEHLAEERPSVLTRWLFQRHPTVAQRLALAEAYRRSIGMSQPGR
jgi:STE24 endopeptidase